MGHSPRTSSRCEEELQARKVRNARALWKARKLGKRKAEKAYRKEACRPCDSMSKMDESFFGPGEARKPAKTEE